MTQARIGYALPTVPARLDHGALAFEGEADLTDTGPKARPCPGPEAACCTPMLPAGPSDSATPASSPRRGLSRAPQQPQTLLVSCLCVQGLTLCQADDTAASSSHLPLAGELYGRGGDPGQNHLPTQADGQLTAGTSLDPG